MVEVLLAGQEPRIQASTPASTLDQRSKKRAMHFFFHKIQASVLKGEIFTNKSVKHSDKVDM
jgi:hypothetical protein